LTGGQLGELITSHCNIGEVERNLTRKLPEAFPIWNEFLKRTGIRIVPCRQRIVKGINPKDSPIAASAIAVRATHFVTGDKKLLVELTKRQRASFAAVTPREMLDVILTVSRG
jgi:predicted nucleic acid-binding protein